MTPPLQKQGLTFLNTAVPVEAHLDMLVSGIRDNFWSAVGLTMLMLDLT